MVLLIDNYDSFTYNLYDYIQQIGLDCKVVRNDELSLSEIELLEFSSVVISPGPKTPKEAGITIPVIENFFNKKPILGICLGHQAIGEFFGAKLSKADVPVHGKTSLIKHTDHFIFNNLPEQFEVMRYHSLLLRDVEKTPLKIIASSAKNEVMAVAHPELKIAGLQFHPESILTQHGLAILRNWFSNI